MGSAKPLLQEEGRAGVENDGNFLHSYPYIISWKDYGSSQRCDKSGSQDTISRIASNE